jgi:hypothetical protein
LITQKKTFKKLEKKQSNIVPMAICHFDQMTVSTQMILQLKPSALTTELTMQIMKLSSTKATLMNTL